ncbi:hypothetical protein SFOMI_3259 [Sphingobium fuliginis]|uniref:Uncharacterized protein n=1 Tax=Sphingobium fuliginis (strain ATCC 27551) TaxID=336203 RepID=A0A292ZHY6_SPHSA|nr:hypothetical protein SFOMI_3259 [Sphingobium fuliginis]
MSRLMGPCRAARNGSMVGGDEGQRWTVRCGRYARRAPAKAGRGFSAFAGLTGTVCRKREHRPASGIAPLKIQP